MTSTRSDVCSICLENAQVRGGSPLFAPGCCGKWYHQDCINNVIVNGDKKCPNCRATINFQMPTAVPQQQQQQQSAVVSLPTPPQTQTMDVSSYDTLPLPPPIPMDNIDTSNVANIDLSSASTQNNRRTLRSITSGLLNSINLRAPTRRNNAPVDNFPIQQQTVNSFGCTQTPISIRPGDSNENQADLEEDRIEPSTAMDVSAGFAEANQTATNTASAAGAEAFTPQLTATITPEYPETITGFVPSFYTRVQAKFEDLPEAESLKYQTPLDLVCILDNSGSMSGSKIDSLKHAMEFVVSAMGPKDRLSIVSFNSYTKIIHGLKAMGTAEKKDYSKALIDSIRAGGGTNIYQGMSKGWDILQTRQTKNPTSCIFLLTDGQDRSRLPEKQQIAQEIRTAGTSLYVFGFGNDHDSAHMQAIAAAGEGSFTYIESNDAVVDAFGGAIGLQQGLCLSQVDLVVGAAGNGGNGGIGGGPPPSITRALTSYRQATNADRSECVVSFANLYPGESRDVLLELRLPALAAAGRGGGGGGGVEDGDGDNNYPLLTATVAYTVMDGTTNTASSAASPIPRGTTPAITCAIARHHPTRSAIRPPHRQTRNLGVDVQLNRIRSTEAIAEALKVADGGQYDTAKEVLLAAMAAIAASFSYRAEGGGGEGKGGSEAGTETGAGMSATTTTAIKEQNGGETSKKGEKRKSAYTETDTAEAAEAAKLSRSYHQDLMEALEKVRSHGSYHSGGGRALMTEAHHEATHQRSCYTRAGKANRYQSAKSNMVQTSWASSKQKR